MSGGVHPDPAGSVSLLLYDNKYDGRSKRRDLLYRSAAHFGVPYQVGSLLPARLRPWEAGDREEWLLRTLPGVKSKLVVLLDATDAVLFCGMSEMIDKWLALAGTASNGRSRVLVGVEQQLWPEEQYYSFESSKRKADYPRAPMGYASGRPGRAATGTPFRFINIGMLAGPPDSVHGLLRCMQERYAGFPRQCPGGRLKNGSYEYFSNAPHRTRFGVFSGHWGWEQSCFHNYYFEQVHGHLPAHCPELVLDYRAEVIFNLKRTVDALQLDWKTFGARPRINSTWLPSLQDVRPCVVHANSATKAIMPILQLFLENVHLAAKSKEPSTAALPPNPISPTYRELFEVVNSWHDALINKTLTPCVIGARTIPVIGANEAQIRHACFVDRRAFEYAQRQRKLQPG